MKKIFTLFIFSFIALFLFAQAPQGVSYQAIAFDASGSAVASSSVGVRISVLEGSATGTAVYIETHSKTTNAQGLFNLSIGQGTPTTGTFAGINWATGNKFLKVEVDPAGGTSYTSVGTNELMSVPYALFAESTTSSPGNIAAAIIASKAANFAFNDYNDDKIYVFNSLSNSWSSQTYNSGTSPSIEEAKGNFIFNDYNDDKIYVFNANSDLWSSQTYNSGTSPSLEIDTLLGNVSFNDYNDDKIYTFTSITGLWSFQTYNSGTSPSIIVSKGNFAFNDYNDDKIYVYNAETGLWSSQTYNSGTSPSISASNGNFVFNDYNDDKIYVYNGQTGLWSSQTYNSGTSPSIIISETD